MKTLASALGEYACSVTFTDEPERAVHKAHSIGACFYAGAAAMAEQFANGNPATLVEIRDELRKLNKFLEEDKLEVFTRE